MTNEQFYSFLRSSIDNSIPLTYIPQSKVDWLQLYNNSVKQAIQSVVFDQIKRITNLCIPKELLYEWIAQDEQIKQRNILLNRKCVEVTQLFRNAGFRSCILKGQGNALMYPRPLSRISGDIDIWVEGNRNDIKKFVLSQTPNAPECYHHIHLSLFEDVDIEVHFVPCTCLSISSNNRFEKYCQTQMAYQVNNLVTLPECLGQVSVPTREFNIIFQMAHIMYHFFIEGIGLRHFVDYYYVLKSEKNGHSNKVEDLFDKFGMLKFSKGVMWVEKVVLGIEDSSLVVEPNEKVGKIILAEIMEGGNFGHFDKRYSMRSNGYLARGVTDTIRLLKLSSIFPKESFWKIFRKLENQRWKL